jgi:hypothetical protein
MHDHAPDGSGKDHEMTLRLTEKERSRMQGMIRRPRTRKQLYRAEALLALADGRPVEEVARQHRVGVERVERWVEGFEASRIKFLEEPGGSGPMPRPEVMDTWQDADEAGRGGE